MAVDGSVTPDQFRVSRTEPLRIVEIVHGHKPHLARLVAGRGRAAPPGSGKTGSIPPAFQKNRSTELAHIGMRLEQYFGAAQDVEWVLDQQNRFQIVQSRPLHLEQAHLDWSDFYPWREMAKAPQPLFKNLQVGSSGAACGKAVLVKHPGQTGTLPSGSVFVVSNTAPDLVNLLPKSAGIVAERGNTSGHLAIIAREFDVPLLIGCPMEQAEMLSSQSLITLDAFTGAVFPGRIDPLLQAAKLIMEQGKKAPPSPLQIFIGRGVAVCHPAQSHPSARSLLSPPIRKNGSRHDPLRP